MPGPPVYTGTTISAYDTGGGDAPDSLLGITEDWEDWFPTEEGRFKWALTRQPRLYIWSGTERDVTLSLNLRSFELERDVTLRLGDDSVFQTRIGKVEQPVTVKWQIPKVHHGDHYLQQPRHHARIARNEPRWAASHC